MRRRLGWRETAAPPLAAAGAVVALLVTAGCTTGSLDAAPIAPPSIGAPTSIGAPAFTSRPASTPSASASRSPEPSAATPDAAPVAGEAGGSDPKALVAPATGGSLRGMVVVIDPGHNGTNGRYASRISRNVGIGNGSKACDTTGTQTNAGYRESAFTFDVAARLAALLRARGATVVLTRANDRGVGPCISERAAIGNRARADAAISIHADGATAAGFGFHVIVPKGIGRNDSIVAPSQRLGVAVRDAFHRGTGEPLSTYTGTRTGGLVTRGDLGGLNLSAVPKVFIECGNMRNAADARRLSSPAWRQRAAAALAAGLTGYLSA